jgi:hypothetical protein
MKEYSFSHLIRLFIRVIESKTTVTIEQSLLFAHPQNYIVYMLVIGIAIYVLLSIYLNRKPEPTGCLAKRHSLSSRRGR